MDLCWFIPIDLDFSWSVSLLFQVPFHLVPILIWIPIYFSPYWFVSLFGSQLIWMTPIEFQGHWIGIFRKIIWGIFLYCKRIPRFEEVILQYFAVNLTLGQLNYMYLFLAILGSYFNVPCLLLQILGAMGIVAEQSLPSILQSLFAWFEKQNMIEESSQLDARQRHRSKGWVKIRDIGVKGESKIETKEWRVSQKYRTIELKGESKI